MSKAFAGALGQMAADKGSSKRRMAYCSRCKQDFVTYSVLATRCPRCGRRSHTLTQRRLLRLITIVILLGVAIAAGVGYWLSR